jgi:SAM-dependent methyltransferase
VADLGCGNFNTGKAIAPLVARYTGVDIAQPVIDANTRAYSGERIRFVRADLTRDPLPRADAAIVRQVLQHLTNSEIGAALDNILHAYPLVFITEHLYTGRGSRPNLDIPHGPGTRVPMKSGVWIDQPPFSARATLAGDIEYAPNEVLRTWAVTAS